MKIVATSKTKFKLSKSSTPSKKEIFKAYVTAKGLNVRTWAGASHSPCSFSPLSQGDIVSVCDAVLSADNKTWYYICYDGKYGFLNALYVESVPEKALKAISCLSEYNDYIKVHYKYFINKYDSNMTTFKSAKETIKSGKTVGITCVVPLRWALAEMNIKRADGKALISGNNGTFKPHYTGNIKTCFELLTTGTVIGLTVKQAIDKGLLKIGDVVCYANHTHTSVYSGEGYYFYEGGSQSAKNKYANGVKIDYKKYPYKISEILRWKG